MIKVNLRDLVERAKHDNNALMEVINLFSPKIKKSLHLTNVALREELLQDQQLKLTVCIRNYDYNSVPGFWAMREEYSKQ